MKINKEGYNIIAFVLCMAIAVWATCFLVLPWWIGWPMGLWALVSLCFVVAFFREPRRPYISDPSLVYAPADGKVVVVEEVMEKEYLGQKCIQVSIFMSLTNVHVNWFPVGGTVEYFRYHPGKFLVAWHPKSSEDNERTTTVVNTGTHKVLFRQVAGWVARRIVSNAKPGEAVAQNTKCGFIKFGSRLDIMLPLDAEILVKLEDKTVGSQTPIARLK